MKVDKINYNNLKPSLKNTTKSYQPGFTANISTSLITKELDPMMPWFIRFFNKLYKCKGEKQDIIITALGTGLIAPIFIKWNPLSKSDEDTRTYSAMRQPISAVLAVATQAGALIPIDIWLNKKFDEGTITNKNILYNRSMFQDEKYITRLMKKLHPTESKEEIKVRVDKYKDLQTETLHKNIKNNTILAHIKENGKDKLIPLENKEFNNLVNETLDKMINEAEQEIKRCDNEKKTSKIARREYFRTNSEEAEKVLNEIYDEIKNTNDNKKVEAKIKEVYKTLKREKKNKELVNLVKEIHLRGLSKDKDCLIAVKDKITDTLKAIDEVKNFKSVEEVEKLIETNINNRVSCIKDYHNSIQELKAAFADGKLTVGDLETKLKNIIAEKSLLLEKTKNNGGNRNIVKNVIERLNNVNLTDKIAELYKAKIKGNIDGFKRITNLVVALGMLPISCSLLNWVYPRLMDILFPNLSNKKHAKVSTEYVDKASQKAEVKS